MADATIFASACESKICSKCRVPKPRTEFNKVRGKERALCKMCHVAESKRWANDNRERRREYAREWAAANIDKVRAYAKRTYKSRSPERVAKKKIYRRKRHLERKYGITQPQWDAMFEAQGGVCALCKVPGRAGRHGKLVVDHCHETGKVRGLLCGPCNVAIGILGETVERFECVTAYLKDGFSK